MTPLNLFYYLLLRCESKEFSSRIKMHIGFILGIAAGYGIAVASNYTLFLDRLIRAAYEIRNINRPVLTKKNGYLEIKYKFRDREYISVVPFVRGPAIITTALSPYGADISAQVRPYLGPLGLPESVDVRDVLGVDYFTLIDGDGGSVKIYEI